jgi:hypothetical protein
MSVLAVVQFGGRDDETVASELTDTHAPRPWPLPKLCRKENFSETE